jgi:hypothetical protein
MVETNVLEDVKIQLTKLSNPNLFEVKSMIDNLIEERSKSERAEFVTMSQIVEIVSIT